MAASVRVLRAVKPHVPMIKFPLRNGKVKELETPHQHIASLDLANPQNIPIVQSTSSDKKSIGSTARGSVIDFKDLPDRLKRKLISNEEMEYIERGGPE